MFVSLPFLFCLSVVLQDARADTCDDGSITIVTGEVGEIFQNKADSWTIPVAHGAGDCFSKLHAPVIISDTRPPASCRREAKLQTTIQIGGDDLFGLGVDQKRLLELKCN